MTPLIVAFALLFAVLLFVACAQPHKRPEPFPCRPMKNYERYKLKPLEPLDWSYMDPWYIREFAARIEECTRSQLLDDQYR